LDLDLDDEEEDFDFVPAEAATGTAAPASRSAVRIKASNLGMRATVTGRASAVCTVDRMTENPDMPGTREGDDSDIPDTMPPAGGGGVETDDAPMGVDPEDDSKTVPGIPDVGEAATDG
jgi:hypothetical protein